MSDKSKAIVKGVSEGAIEAIKLLPGAGVLIEGIRSYHDSIEEAQRQSFIEGVVERLNVLEEAFTNEWYQTPNGEEVVKKIVATALNAEFTDKIDYFTNALFNAPAEISQLERLKFVELIRNLSKSSLLILAKEEELQRNRGKYHSPQVIQDQLIKSTGLNPYLVEASIRELSAQGVFSSVAEFKSSSEPKTIFSGSAVAFTDFSRKFIDFIKDPRSR
jgi:hypothetical protein